MISIFFCVCKQGNSEINNFMLCKKVSLVHINLKTPCK